MNLQSIRISFALLPGARAELYELLASFIADGIPTYNAIQEVDRQLEREKKPLARMTASVLRAMQGQSGQALTPGQAFGKFVPAVEAMAIDAGADAGKAHEGFLMAKHLCETHQQTAELIFAETLYPVALLLLFMGLLTLVGQKLLPTMTALIPRHRWSPSAQALGWLGDNSVAIVVVMCVSVVLVVAAYFRTRDSWTGRARDFFDKHVFPWNVNCSVNGALLLSAVAVMLRASVPFDAVLTKMGKTSGRWMNYHFALMRARLRRGAREGEALAVNLYDEDTRWQILLYGRVHNFAEGIERLSGRVVKRVLARVKRQFSLVKYVLMFAVALMLAWVFWTFLDLALAARYGAGAPM